MIDGNKILSRTKSGATLGSLYILIISAFCFLLGAYTALPVFLGMIISLVIVHYDLKSFIQQEITK